MRPLSLRFSLFSRLGVVVALGAATCLLGACDQHSSAEVPESYGHGSNRQPNYDNHQIDSRKNSRSFSDTQGTEAEGKDGEHKAAPGESPGASPSGRFFPNG